MQDEGQDGAVQVPMLNRTVQVHLLLRMWDLGQDLKKVK